MELHKAEKTVYEMIELYSLNGWKFKFSKSVKAFGTCSYRKKTIYLSKKLTELNPYHTVLDTILHEIAHALCPNEKHGMEWQRVAISIGCSGARFYGDEVLCPPKKVRGTCPRCKIEIQRYRKIKNLACSKCCKKYSGGNYDASFIFEWSKI